jgi:hypothetical protein
MYKYQNKNRLTYEFSCSDVSANNDRRTAHNALERQRREHLNSKFQQLAHALPSLKNIRRPSKTTIVAKSLEFGKINKIKHGKPY